MNFCKFREVSFYKFLLISAIILLGVLGVAKSSQASALSDLANSMQPGTWAELTTNGLTQSLLNDPCLPEQNYRYILEYSDDAMWSSVSREFWFAGGGHTGCGNFIRYIESTNSWTTSGVGSGFGTHDYHLTTIDPVANVMYKLRAVDTNFQRYSRNTDSWSNLPGSPGGCIGAIMHFPERNSVISAYSYGCGGAFEVDEYNIASNSWSVRATNLAGAASYHSVGGYSPVHEVVIFGGGNNSRTLYRMNAAGTIQRMADAPIDLTIWHSTVIIADPVTGDFLVLGNNSFWSYNPITDIWTSLNTANQIPPSSLRWEGIHGVVAASNSTYGVAMYLTWNGGSPKMYLYKHAASGPTDTTPPTVSITAPSSGSTVSGSSVTVSANASDNVGVVGVQFKLDGVNLGSEDTTSPYSISWNTTGTTNGSYTLTAVARDAAGNQTTSSGITVTVNNISDTQAPTTPTNLSAIAISSSQINLSWIASTDNVGVTGYRIYRCQGVGCTPSTQTATTVTNSYSDSGLSASTVYVYRVAAFDAAGNVSNQSASASATTQASAGGIIHIYPGTNVFSSAAQSLVAGDTLIVHQGTYNETVRMSIQVQGTASQPIVIQGAAGESRPIITRPGSASVQNTINIEGNAAYLTIKGLEIIGNGGDGIAPNGNLSYITIEDNIIHDVDVGIGIHTSVSNFTIRKNHIYNTGIGSGTGEGMYIGCNYASCIVSNSLIEGNWIHDNLPGTSQGDGIEIKVGSYGNTIKDNVIYNMFYPGILVYGTGSNPVNIIEGNVVWNTLEGISAISDAVVRNNIVIGATCGLCAYTHTQVSQYKNLTFVNNTLHNNDEGLQFQWSSSGSNVIVANNAFYSPGKTAVRSNGTLSSTGAIVSSNYIEGSMTGESISGSRFISGGTSANAFISPSTNNFWPKTGSPLLNNANATYAPSNDFNNTSRVSPYDVGAYETNGLTSNPGWAITQGFKVVGGSMPPDTTPPSAPTGVTVN